MVSYAGKSADSIPVPRGYAFWGWLFRLFGRVLGRATSEPLPDLGGRPTVLVANHTSLADIFYAVAVLSAWGYPARCLVRHTYFSGKLMGGWLRSIGFIAAGGGGTDAATEAIKALRQGTPVAVMPEGRIIPPNRRQSDGMGEFRAGFMDIARGADAQILPVALVGSDGVWGSTAKLPKLGFRRPKVVLGVGTPIDVMDLADEQVELAVRAQMAEIISRL